MKFFVDAHDKTSGISPLSAAAAISLPLGLVLCSSGGDLTPALSLAGGLGVPLLYGILPVWMAWKGQDQMDSPLVPMGSMGVLGTMAVLMFGTNLFEQVSRLI